VLAPSKPKRKKFQHWHSLNIFGTIRAWLSGSTG